MLLTRTGVISKSQHEEKSVLRCAIEELNKNTVLLIAQAETNRNSYRPGSNLSKGPYATTKRVGGPQRGD